VLERALLLINTPHTYFTILCNELAAASMGFAATVCMHGSTATYTLSSSGAWESLSSDISSPRSKGEKIFASTEPDAGSDAAAIRTQATKVEGSYRLKDTKILTSNAIVAGAESGANRMRSKSTSTPIGQGVRVGES
jgi:alkylation response protein AidB-like acyl-CoA dehydrogenase